MLPRGFLGLRTENHSFKSFLKAVSEKREKKKEIKLKKKKKKGITTYQKQGKGTKSYTGN